MLKDTTPHTPHLNGVLERTFSVIKEAELVILFHAQLNDTSQRMMWVEAVHTCKLIRKSMDTTGSTTSPLKNINRKKLKIIGLFLEFGRIGYVTKW